MTYYTSNSEIIAISLCLILVAIALGVLIFGSPEIYRFGIYVV